MTRFRSLDALRVLMCVGVAAFHGRSYFLTEFGAAYEYAARLSYFTDTFFVVTGFLTAKVYADRESFGAFLWGRFARLYPLHLVTTAAMIPAVLFIKGEPHSVGDIVASLALVNQWGGSAGNFVAFNAPAWFLSAILGCYLLYPGAYAIVRWNPILGLGLVLGAAFAAHHVMLPFPSGLSQAHTVGFGILRGVPSFLFGLVLSQVRFPSRCPAIPMLILAWVVARFLVGETLYDLERLGVVYAFVSAVLWLDRAGAPLSLGRADGLARYSFGVFLIHVPVQRVTAFALPAAYKGQDTVLSLPLIAATIAISFGLAVLSLRYLETPALRWLTRPAPRLITASGE